VVIVAVTVSVNFGLWQGSVWAGMWMYALLVWVADVFRLPAVGRVTDAERGREALAAPQHKENQRIDVLPELAPEGEDR